MTPTALVQTRSQFATDPTNPKLRTMFPPSRRSPMMPPVVLSAALMIIVLVFNATMLAPPVRANPSGADPLKPLASMRVVEGAESTINGLYEQLKPIYGEFANFVANQNQPERIPPQKIHALGGKIWAGQQDARQVLWMGEPAGHDLDAHYTLLFRRIAGQGNRSAATPKGSAYKARIRQKLDKRATRDAKLYSQAEAALSSGKHAAVYQKMRSFGIDLWADMSFFSPKERERYTKRFNTIWGTAMAAVERERTPQYVEQLVAAANDSGRSAAEVITIADNAASQIRGGGEVTVGDATAENPLDAARRVGDAILTASTDRVRAEAIAMAVQFKTGDASNVNFPAAGVFAEQSAAAMGRVIEAVGGVTPPNQIAATYGEMLKLVARLDRRCGGNNRFTSGCQSGLDTFAARDPALQRRIALFDRANAAALRFRESFVRARTKRLGANYPSLSQVSDAVEPPPKEVRANYLVGPLPKTKLTPDKMGDAVAIAVAEAQPRIKDRAISFDNVVQLRSGSPLAVMPHDGRRYVNLALPMKTQPIADAFKTSMLCGSHPPLGMPAAAAIAAAEETDLAASGGKVAMVHAEPLLARMATLSGPIAVVQRFGDAIQVPGEANATRALTWRFDVKADWAATRHVVFE